MKKWIEEDMRECQECGRVVHHDHIHLVSDGKAEGLVCDDCVKHYSEPRRTIRRSE